MLPNAPQATSTRRFLVRCGPRHNLQGIVKCGVTLVPSGCLGGFRRGPGCSVGGWLRGVWRGRRTRGVERGGKEQEQGAEQEHWVPNRFVAAETRVDLLEGHRAEVQRPILDKTSRAEQATGGAPTACTAGVHAKIHWHTLTTAAQG